MTDTCGSCKWWRYLTEHGDAGYCVEVHGSSNSTIRFITIQMNPALAWRYERFNPPCPRHTPGEPALFDDSAYATPEERQSPAYRERQAERQRVAIAKYEEQLASYQRWLEQPHKRGRPRQKPQPPVSMSND